MNSQKDEKYYQKKMTAKQKNEEKKYLTFRVASETYALNLRKTKEIIKPSKITVVPNTEEYIIGVINLRGQIVPVIDMGERLKLTGDKAAIELRKIIIVEIEDVLIGLMVAQVNEVVEVNEEKIEEVNETTDNIKRKYIKGVIRVKNNLIILMNLKNLLQSGSQEKERLAVDV